MSNFPAINARDIIDFLLYLGFNETRQKGSHKFFKHRDGRTATVPYHKGETLGRGITAKILRDVEVDKHDFMKWYLL